MHKQSSTNETRGVILMMTSVLLFAVNVLAIRGLSIHVPGIDGFEDVRLNKVSPKL